MPFFRQPEAFHRPASWRRVAYQIAATVLDALFPRHCAACRALFKAPDPSWPLSGKASPEGLFRDLTAGHLCPACANDFLPMQSPACPVCGIMFPSREGEDHLCGDCLTSPKQFDLARAVGDYSRSLRVLIHQLKYHGRIELARPLGRLLFSEFLHQDFDPFPQIVLPVPLHPARMRSRGFNQAWLLIRHWRTWARDIDGAVPEFGLDHAILRRVRPTPPQISLNRKQRLLNVKNAFAVSNHARLQDKSLLLVDDVATTSATLNECARVLKKAGAKRVYALTLARAL